MDNVCHTLVGAVCGEAGLKSRSRFGSAALMIAANLPDIDVAVFATGTPSVVFRRGITHGIAAQAILPPVLAFIMWRLARRRDAAGHPPAHFGWLVVLAYVGVLSHVALDYLNTYGIRLLMPFSNRWFYGDTLFIIDPWMWLVLGLGVWLARRSRSPRPARQAIAVATVYIIVMLTSARAARQIVLTAWEETHGSPPVALMVGPNPITPLTRQIIVDAGDSYALGTLTWFPRSVTFVPRSLPKNAREPLVDLARRDEDVRGFLVWSRFPVWTLAHEPDGTRVTVSDMRFGARLFGRAGFTASVLIR
jgi:inner membrane protein